MLACVDVHYVNATAIAGCLLFWDWTDADFESQYVSEVALDAPYKAGEFYLRELPPILAVLKKTGACLATIIVDGYVWLGRDQPGLGARLHAALPERVSIVGVAKTAWGGSSAREARTDDPHRVVAVTRGASSRPLFVTSAGVDVDLAAEWVRKMHGEYRIPTLLKAVDRLARSKGGSAWEE